MIFSLSRAFNRLYYVARLSAILVVVVGAFFRPAFSQVLRNDFKTIHVKFKKEFVLDEGISSQRARTGMANMDHVSESHNAFSIERIFPPAGKFEAAHRAYDLHLWYEIKFSKDVNVEAAVADYMNLEYFQKVEECKEYTAGWDRETTNLELPSGANDPYFSSHQWHYDNRGQSGGTPGSDINLKKAWQIESGSSEVIVAVIDGGISLNHPDLNGALWRNKDEIPGNGVDDDRNGYVDDYYGYGFGDRTSTIYPDDHGTHVAGTVGAISNNGIGVSGIAGGSGLADGVRLMSCATFGKFSNGGFEAAMIYAADNGAVISQNSWGGGSSAIEAAIDYFINRAGYDNSAANYSLNIQTGPMAGGLVVFAAGNASSPLPLFSYPSTYPKVISVASVDHKDVKASTSNYGDWIDITAPGDNVYSTIGTNSYGYLSGTSMACPHVSGAAALVVSYLQRKGLKPGEVRNRLLFSADDISAKNPGVIGLLGAGRLDAYMALRHPDVIAPAAISDLHGSEIRFNSITIQWTATGESGNVGTAEAYEIRYSTNPITESNFNSATLILNPPVPLPSGQQVSYKLNGLPSSRTYYFAIKSSDIFNNYSIISNIATVTTLGPPVVATIESELTADLFTGGTSIKELHVINIGEDELVAKFFMPSWLKGIDETVTIASGDTAVIQITFDATGLATGHFTEWLWVDNTSFSSFGVPSTLNVTSAPDLETSKEIIFDKQFLGYPRDSSIYVKNNGVNELIISDIHSTDSQVVPSLSSLTLAPGEEAELNIAIVPLGLGDINASITFSSNDPDEGTFVVSVHAEIIPVPTIEVIPGSLSAIIPIGKTRTLTFMATNTGSVPFQWKANYPGSSEPPPGVGQFTLRAPSPAELTSLSYDSGSQFIYAKALSVNTFYRYNLTTNTWATVGTAPGGIIGQAACLDGKIYHSGSQLSIYSIESNTWTTVPFPFASSTLTLVSDGRYIYVTFNKTLYRFDPTVSSWVQLASISGGFSNSFSGLSYHHGIIYAHEDTSSGITGDGNTPMFKYLIASDLWIDSVSKLPGKVGSGSSIDPFGRRYYAVGARGTKFLDILDIYENTTEKKVTPFSVGFLSGLVYVEKMGYTGIYFIQSSGTGFCRYETAPPGSWLTIEPSTGDLAPGSTQTYTVNVDASGLDEGVHTADITLSSIDPSVAVATVPLTVSVLNAPDISLNKTSVNVGDVKIGKTRAPILVIRNTGTVPLSITSITSDHPDFKITTTSITIQSGETKVVNPYFEPTTIGAATGTFTFHSNDSDQPTIQYVLSGKGVNGGNIEFSPGDVSTSLISGATSVHDFVVNNSGDALVYYSFNPVENWIKGGNGYLAPGESQIVKMTIDASGKTSGTYVGKIEFYSYDYSAGSDTYIDIPVTMTVTSATDIFTSKASLNFGEQLVNNIYDSIIQIKNNGVLPLSITAISSDNPAFSISVDAPLNLAAGQSVDATVRFNPTTIGVQSGQITFISDDPDEGTYVISLLGNGIEPPVPPVPPILVSDQNEMSASAFTNETKEQILTLTNLGETVLNWSVVESSLKPWLSIESLAGEISSNLSQPIEFSFNASNLNTGLYFDTVRFISNDPNRTIMDLQITFNVQYPGPAIEIPSQVQAAGLRPEVYSLQLKIENAGEDSLKWNFTDILPPWITSSKTSGGLAASSFEYVDFTFNSSLFTPRVFNYLLEINSNDLFNPLATSQLSFKTTTILAHEPVLMSALPDQFLTFDEKHISIQETFSDPDNDPLIYTAVSSNHRAATVSVMENSLQINPVSPGETIITLTATDIYELSVSTTFKVSVNQVTGVTPEIRKPSVVAVPNPFNKDVTLRYFAEQPGYASIFVYDVAGRIVWQHNEYQEAYGQNQIAIDGSKLAPGVYNCLLVRNGAKINVRLLKN